MAITFVQYAEAETASGTSLSLSVPAGAAAGDLLVAFIQHGGTRATASSTAFSPGQRKWQQSYFDAAGALDTYVYWRVMESGDTSWTFNVTANNIIQGVIVAYNESTTAKWCMSGGSNPNADTSALTATSEVGFVEDGILFYSSFAYKAGGTITGITSDQGTQRRSAVNAGGTAAIAVYDTITTGEQRTAFTSTVTTTGGSPTDHYALNPFWAQSTPDSGMYDPADLIDGSVSSRTVQVYKGRDTAALDTVGAV
jgi:hypothetical protein